MKGYDTHEKFNADECEKAREGAAVEYLVKELKFKPSDIKIESSRLAPSYNANILWIETSVANVKRIRYKASIMKNHKISLVTYIPSILWDRKSQLLHNCKNVLFCLLSSLSQW